MNFGNFYTFGRISTAINVPILKKYSHLVSLAAIFNSFAHRKLKIPFVILNSENGLFSCQNYQHNECKKISATALRRRRRLQGFGKMRNRNVEIILTDENEFWEASSSSLKQNAFSHIAQR